MNERSLNIIVSGVGGQGTVLAGKLLANCALAGGAFVRSAETIGMAQRGGSVLGHVRICSAENSTKPASPLIPRGQAQLLIGFEPAETLRAYPLCAPSPIVVTAIDPLLPPVASLLRLDYDGSNELAALEQEQHEGRIGSLILVDNRTILDSLGFDKALNVVLLGAALAALEASEYAFPLLSFEAMQQTLKNTLRQRFVEPNLRALEMGYQLLCT